MVIDDSLMPWIKAGFQVSLEEWPMGHKQYTPECTRLSDINKA